MRKNLQISGRKTEAEVSRVNKGEETPRLTFHGDGRHAGCGAVLVDGHGAVLGGVAHNAPAAAAADKHLSE